MNLENYEKKRKRGKRGGRKLEDSFGHNSFGQSEETMIKTTENHISEDHGEDQDVKRKKTRRSKTKPTQQYYEDTVGDQEHAEIDFQQSVPNHEDLIFLNPESKQYFLEIEKQLTTLEDEELYLLVENVFEAVFEEKLEVLKDYETSKIIEKLLDLAKPPQIIRFYKFIGIRDSPTDFNVLIRDQFASHVLQKLLIVSSTMVENELLGHLVVKEENLESLADLVIAFAELVEKEDDLMFHTRASFVFRTLLQVLSGHHEILNTKVRSKKSVGFGINQGLENNAIVKSRLVPESFTISLNKIVEQVCRQIKLDEPSKENLKYLAKHPIANPVLQMLVSLPTSSQKLVDGLLDTNSDTSFLKSLISDTVGSHLFEKLCKKASKSALKTIFKSCFEEDLLDIVNGSISNFSLQAMIENMTSKTDFEVIVNKLVPLFPSFIFGKANRVGIVVKILNATLHPKLQKFQKVCLESIMESFEAQDEESRLAIAALILNLRTFKNYQERVFVHRPAVNGSLILQSLLQFKNSPIPASILNLDDNDLMFWACDSISSRVFDKFVSSGTKESIALIKRFKGKFVQLAKDKYASHFVDVCFKNSNLTLKTAICEELVTEKGLADNFHARFVVRNCALEVFAKRRDEWIKYQNNKGKEVVAGGDEIDQLFASR